MRGQYGSDITYLPHILLLVGYDTAYTTPGVLHITFVPRNHVDMDMSHRLSRRLANIDTDVVTIRFVCLIKDDFHLIDQRPDGRLFFCRRLEVLGNMPVWNYQAVAGINRIAIIVGKSQLIFDNHSGVATKDTILMFGHIRTYKLHDVSWVSRGQSQVPESLLWHLTLTPSMTERIKRLFFQFNTGILLH